LRHGATASRALTKLRQPMLFNSYTFIFFFLPITLAIFFALVPRAPRHVAMIWLVICSLFFYAWWRPVNLILLGASLVFNYLLGLYLGRHSGQPRGRVALVIGLTANLAVLSYFKYANFFLDTLRAVTGTHWSVGDVILPLGISFFTFQKIAYLVDAYRGQVRGYNFVDYCLFVTFFPQLIAGPIVHHSEVIPQFTKKTDYCLSAEDFSVGLTQFVFGLFKKVIIADRISLYATPIFEAAQRGATPTFIDGWIAALAYTFQLYFDFSGYSDMALGLGRMFGIKLPLNFNSPYKARNITEFWRRWHMTLSRFLRDYLYIPLGGNRKGPARRYLNLMVTMLLGGLWHGAGWTFVFWGALHGIYLIVHQAWMKFRGVAKGEPHSVAAWTPYASRTLTFLAVIVAWVFFRSADFATSIRMLSAMAGVHGFGFTTSFKIGTALLSLAVLWIIVWWMPNTQEVLARFKPALEYLAPARARQELITTPSALLRWTSWRATVPWALGLAGVALFIFTQMARVSEFIYWQF
jgi:D-alanyl-lipoteichoic acid acyltransferase DltB (MBOAT superfamily)